MDSQLRNRVTTALKTTQLAILAQLEQIEATCGSDRVFHQDLWQRQGGGGGDTRVMLEGEFLEKGGVNFSEVYGELSPEFAKQLPGSGLEFYASGLSLVLHPKNPFVPTVHANFRYIEHGDKRWFGGGADLTPYYFFPEDRDHFHGVWRMLCESHESVADYPKFSRTCDEYFYLKHRGERRGVGGIFFDNLLVDETRENHAEQLLAFAMEGANSFLSAYIPIVRRRLGMHYGDHERRWQALRRGRYVEFNLLYDRGTMFGLKTGGRTESILMSLPPKVEWGYNEEPAPGTPEAALLQELRKS